MTPSLKYGLKPDYLRVADRGAMCIRLGVHLFLKAKLQIIG